jgi:4Fe-4S ferredoxin
MANVMEVYKLLPQTNCKKCGEATCMAFAVALIGGKRRLEECTPLFEEEKYQENIEKLKKMVAVSESATETGLIVHEDLCTGCGNCVVACPVNVANDPYGAGSGKGATNDRVIFTVVDGKVVAANIKECRRFGKNRILCNACIHPCPTGAIEFV